MAKFSKILFILIFLFPNKSFSLIEVDITRGNLNPLPIAVSSLYSDEKSKKEFKKELKLEDVGNEISKVVENNLMKTGLFNPLEKDSFLQNPIRVLPFKTRSSSITIARCT